MSLREIKTAYERGELTKVEYFVRMQGEHARLREYAEFLRGTNLAAITLSDEGVVFTTRDGGVRILCDPNDMGIPPIVTLNLNHYESTDGAMLMSLIDDGMTVFDIGANLGWYGLHVARQFPKTRVFAFEPVPKTFGFLRENVRLNGLTNMQAFPFGLSNESRECVFYVNPVVMGAASSSELACRSGEPTVCHLRTLDEVADELGTGVDFIKADVEGAELFVFQGGLRSISRHRPIIFAEMLRKHAATFHYHPNDIIALLAQIGYECFTCREGRLKRFETMDEQTVETNFVFLHPEKHALKMKALVS